MPVLFVADTMIKQTEYNFGNRSNQMVVFFYPKDLFIVVVDNDVYPQADISVELFACLGSNWRI